MTSTPTIVFDIDGLLAIRIRDVTEEDLKLFQENKMVQKAELFHLKFEHEGENVSVLQVVFPGWVDCMKQILSWKWNIALFSSGFKIRNELFRDALCEKLNVDSKTIQVFSFHDMVKSESKSKMDQIMYGTYKKQLVSIGLDLESSLLIEDDSSFISPGEYPQFVLSEGNEWTLQDLIHGIKNGKKPEKIPTDIPCWDFSSVVLGFLDWARNEMKQNSCSLRQTVKKIFPPLDEIQQSAQATIPPNSNLFKRWMKDGNELLLKA